MTKNKRPETALSEQIEHLVVILLAGETGEMFDSHIGIHGYIADVVNCFSELVGLAEDTSLDAVFDCEAYDAARESIAAMLGCRRLRPALSHWLKTHPHAWPDDFTEEVARIVRFA